MPVIKYGGPNNVSEDMYSRISGRDDWKLYINDYYWVLAIDGYHEFYYNPQFYMDKIESSLLPPSVLYRLERSCKVFTAADRNHRGEIAHKSRHAVRVSKLGADTLRTGNIFYRQGAWCATCQKKFVFNDPYSYEGDFTCSIHDITWEVAVWMMTMSATTITHHYVREIGDLWCFAGVDPTDLVEQKASDSKAWADQFAKVTMNIRIYGSQEYRDQLRSMRKDLFRETIRYVREGTYVSESGKKIELPDPAEMIRGARMYYTEIRLPEGSLPSEQTSIRVENKDCLLAAKELLEAGYNPAVLNMANRQNPGGGVTEGAGAQEENMFRRSNAHLGMYQFAAYAESYGLKKSSSQYPMHRDFGGVYVPGMTVFRGEEKDGYPLLEEYYQVGMIAVAAMNRPELDRNGRIAGHLIGGMKNKIRTIFRIGILHGHDALVLGALGCGAFRNPPAHVAQLFHEVMEEAEFKNRFKVICFAILEDHNSGHAHNREGNYLPFARELGVI